MRGLEHLSYNEVLREVRLFRLERTWLRGLLITMYKYLMRESKIVPDSSQSRPLTVQEEGDAN